MIRILTLSVLALSLAACANGATSSVDPVAGVRTPVGEASQANWEAGQAAYLAWNGARRGWTTTASGLQYRRVGDARPDGEQPVAADTVKVHYRGTFIDGREFDSSYSRNAPTTFPLGRVIKGWTEGVALMREGETFEFVIPADLAYGARWMGDEIPANSALRFTVELIEVNPGA